MVEEKMIIDNNFEILINTMIVNIIILDFSVLYIFLKRIKNKWEEEKL